MPENLLFNIEQSVATITLHRAELHNAFDDVFIQNLLQILKKVEADPNVRVVILAAAGKSFSAGADLNWMQRMANYSYEENIQDARALADLMQILKCLHKPTIARVQGATYGGGVGLVACCDIAIASTQASFCLSEVKIGLIPAVISPYVIAAIGERAARRYFLTAEVITATRAQELGLITEVVAPEQLDASVQNLVAHLLKNSPQAVTAAKELINRVAGNPYQTEHIEKNLQAIAAMRVSPEGQEGLTAFLQKRTPSWIK